MGGFLFVPHRDVSGLPTLAWWSFLKRIAVRPAVAGCTFAWPDGGHLLGELPRSLDGKHFGAELRRFVLYQHHHCHVTQPLLHEQLREWGIDISVGQIDALLAGHTGAFLAEKDELLTTALAVSRWITVDDTGARHQGRNGYVTQIGNDWLSWFAGTYSKSRINFLQLLQAGELHYTLNSHALEYWSEEGLARHRYGLGTVLSTITGTPWLCAMSEIAFRSATLPAGLPMDSQNTARVLASIFSLDLAIISDGAGQFAILLHALYWVHAERLVHKLIPLNDLKRADQAQVRGEIWALYADLKAYRRNPDPTLRPTLEARFDTIFTQRTSYTTLDRGRSDGRRPGS